MYAVGRYQPARTAPLSKQGSVLCKKRTSLFLVKEDGLTYLSDLPSAGDTAYAGVAIRGSDAYVCYYTSRIDRDYPWIAGMIGATDIRMAKISLPSLAAVGPISSQDPPPYALAGFLRGLADGPGHPPGCLEEALEAVGAPGADAPTIRA